MAQPEAMISKSVKPLDSTQLRQNESVYIALGKIDSARGSITTFLMNETDSLVEVRGLYGRVAYGVDGRAVDGKWRRIYTLSDGCGLGEGDVIISPDHYLPQRFNLQYVQGHFETDLRFTTVVGNNTVVSKVFRSKIDSCLLDDELGRLLCSVNKELTIKDLSLEQKTRLRIRKAEIFISKRQTQQVIEILEPIVAGNSQEFSAYYYLAIAYANQLADRFDDPTIDVTGKIKEIISLLEKVPEGHKKYGTARKAIAAYAEILAGHNKD